MGGSGDDRGFLQAGGAYVAWVSDRVVGIQDVVVDEVDVANSGLGQFERQWRSERPRTDHQDAGVIEPDEFWDAALALVSGQRKSAKEVHRRIPVPFDADAGEHPIATLLTSARSLLDEGETEPVLHVPQLLETSQIFDCFVHERLGSGLQELDDGVGLEVLRRDGLGEGDPTAFVRRCREPDAVQKNTRS